MRISRRCRRRCVTAPIVRSPFDGTGFRKARASGARSEFRRLPHTASAYSSGFDSLIVTHPFHPLAGQRIPVLFERTYRDPTRGHVYVCEAGPLGTVTLPEHFTDRGAAPAARPLTAHYRPIIRAVPWPSALCSGRCAL